jgi:hypothetical protein
VSRTLKELLQALNVTDASAVVFGKLPTRGPSTNEEALVFPSGDTFAAFSEHGSIPISFQECALLQAAGAKDGRPTAFSIDDAQAD